MPRGHFLSLGGQKTLKALFRVLEKLFILPFWPPVAKNYPSIRKHKKTHFWDLENSFFCHFLASKG